MNSQEFNVLSYLIIMVEILVGCHKNGKSLCMCNYWCEFRIGIQAHAYVRTYFFVTNDRPETVFGAVKIQFVCD